MKHKLDNIEDNDFDFWKTCTQSRTRSVTSNVTSFYCLNIPKWLIALKPYGLMVHTNDRLMPHESFGINDTVSCVSTYLCLETQWCISVIIKKYYEPNCNTLFIVVQIVFCKYHFYKINEIHPTSTSHSISELYQYPNDPSAPSVPWFECKLFYWSESGPKYIRIE